MHSTDPPICRNVKSSMTHQRHVRYQPARRRSTESKRRLKSAHFVDLASFHLRPKPMNTFQLDLLSASDLNPKAPAFVPRAHATPVTSLVQSDDEDFEFGQQIGWALDQEDALRNGLYTPPRKPQGSTNSRAHQRYALPSVSGWAHHQRY